MRAERKRLRGRKELYKGEEGSEKGYRGLHRKEKGS